MGKFNRVLLMFLLTTKKSQNDYQKKAETNSKKFVFDILPAFVSLAARVASAVDSKHQRANSPTAAAVVLAIGI